MNDAIYDDLALERIIKESFGFAADVRQVIVRQVSVGPAAEATLFLTDKKQLLLFVQAETRLVLADVKKIVARMGLKAEIYMPPKGHPEYFDAIGREKFREVFPGRGHVSEQDIMFYRTLAPYNPALVLIGEVKNGEVFQYDRDSRSGWRHAAKFTYRRIKTS